jgi:hypothetical protein
MSKGNIFVFCATSDERDKWKNDITKIVGSDRTYENGYNVNLVGIQNRAHLIDGLEDLTKGKALAHLPAIFIGDYYLGTNVRLRVLI